MVIESKSFRAKRKTTSCFPTVGFFIAASGSCKRKGGAGTKPHVLPSKAPNHGITGCVFPAEPLGNLHLAHVNFSKGLNF